MKKSIDAFFSSVLWCVYTGLDATILAVALVFLAVNFIAACIAKVRQP